MEMKRGRGRPKGSRNKPKVDVAYNPPHCGWCQSTSVRTLHTNSMEIVGTTDAGEQYTRKLWRRVMCQSCGKVSINHGFEFDPA